MRLLFAVVAGLLVLAGAPSAVAADRVECRLSDSRISEASGIAAGIASSGIVYVANDSGDTNRFFALDATTCRTVATITVAGARNVDWEDLAVARDATGTPSLWLADIGDNDARRSHVTVYRLDEPRLGREAAGGGGGADRDVTRAVAQTWRLRYPDGPTDAESLAVAPGGAAYVVTKSLLGSSVVYRLPARPAAGVQPLRRTAAVQLTPVGRSRFGLAGALTATGAAFSPDGTRFVIRTYSGAFEWTVRDGDLAAALRARPATVALPAQRQGEGIAIAGDRLLLDSEGAGTDVLSIASPGARTPAARADGSAVAAKASSAPDSSSRAASVAPSGRTPSAPSGSPAKKAKYGNAGSWIPGLLIFGLVIVGSILWWAGQRSRPARERDR